MNGSLRNITISGAIQTLLILLGLVVVAINSYNTSHTADEIKIQSDANGKAVNKTISQANDRGNVTINYFLQLFKQVLNSENSIIGNLSDHRTISNMTRDNQTNQHQQLISLLEQSLNKTR